MSELEIAVASLLFSILVAVIVSGIKILERISRIEEWKRMLEKKLNHDDKEING